jgi:hypothetical protein
MPSSIQGESPFGNESVPLSVKGAYKVMNYMLYFLALIAAAAGAIFVWNTGTEATGVSDEASATVEVN